MTARCQFTARLSMPTGGTQSSSAKIEAAIQAACKVLNAALKANPGCKPRIAAAARRHSVNYSTLRNRFQGHTKPRNKAHGDQQCISPEEETDSDSSCCMARASWYDRTSSLQASYKTWKKSGAWPIDPNVSTD